MPYFCWLISKSQRYLGKKQLSIFDQCSKLHLWLNGHIFPPILDGLYYIPTYKEDRKCHQVIAHPAAVSFITEPILLFQSIKKETGVTLSSIMKQFCVCNFSNTRGKQNNDFCSQAPVGGFNLITTLMSSINDLNKMIIIMA